MNRKTNLNNEDFIESEEYGPISELDYRFFEYMQEGVIVSSPVYENSKVVDLIVKYANLIAYRQRKYSKEGFIDRSIKEIYDPETVAFDLKKANEAISTSRGIKYEIYRPQIDKHFSISAFSPDDKLYVTFSTDITEQKKATEKLNAEKQKLINIIEFLPDATFVINECGIVIAWNRALEEMTGVSKEEIIGKGNYSYSIPFYGHKRPIIIDLIFLSEEEIESKYTYVKRDGETLFAEVFVNNLYGGKGAYVFVKASPLYDSTGKLVGSIETVRDINSQKKAEERVNNERQKLLDIIEFLPDATFVIDEHKHVIAWNKALEEMTDMPKEEILGKGNYEYSIPFYGVRRPILVDLIFLEEKEIESKYDYVRREGDTLFAEVFVNNLYGGKGAYIFVKASPLYDSTGNLVGSIETIRDITERKEFETALHESEEKFRSTIEQSTDGIVIMDENGMIIEWNKGMEKIIGLKKEDVIGKPIWDSQYESLLEEEKTTELYDYIKSTILEFIETGHAPWLNKPLDRKIQRPDGEIRAIQSVTYPIKTEKGMIIGSITRDITKQKKTEEKLKYEENLLNTVLNNIPVAVAVAEAPSGKLIRANEQFEKVWEQPFMPSKNIEAYITYKGFHPDGSPYKPEEWPLARSITTGEVITDEEISVLFEDGARKVLSVSSTPIKDDNGKIILGVVIAADITRRKQAESLLKESEEKFAKAFYFNPAGIAITTIDGEIIEVNNAYANITGYTQEDLLGKTVVDLKIISIEERDNVLKILNKGDSIYNEEREIQTKTGKKRRVLYTVDFIEYGGEKKVFSIIYDITNL